MRKVLYGNQCVNDVTHQFGYEYIPAFDLDYALSQARQMTGRDDTGAHLERIHVSK